VDAALGKRVSQNLEVTFNIYAMTEASDFKFGSHLGFAEVHHKIAPSRKSGLCPGLGELSRIWGFPFNIAATAVAIATSNLVRGLGLPKPIAK